MNRKLASIRRIGSVSPIEGADNIELVTVDGWQCVAKKGEFTEGQYCVYFEIDSFLPIREEFEFLRKSSYRKMGELEGFRLKTIRLRGQISQGLVMPVESFKELNQMRDDHLVEIFFRFHRSNDLAELFGVLKYDPPVPAELSGKCKGNFPSFISKTDQERAQNLWGKIKDRDESFEVTLKLDGTSCTYYLNDGVFGVCGKNFEFIEDENNTFWKIARRYKIEEALRAHGKNIALQGEVVGEGIQGNPCKIKGQDFFLFDIFDIDNRKYYSPKSRHFLAFELGRIKHVPVINNDINIGSFKDVGSLLSFADKPLPTLSNQEGIVFKSNDSDLTFKVISNEYLLK